MKLAFLMDSICFTKAVIAGQTSLGGSESACVGLARAMAQRGHDVHFFVSDIMPDAVGHDHVGATWHPLNDFHAMNEFIEWDATIALRMYGFYAFRPVYARLRLLWNQDLLVPGQMQNGVMGVAWALDHLCYVSDYHRQQWEQLQPQIAPLGWVTRNGFDPADLPATAPTKDPLRIIHVSRPERGLGPLLAMWPAARALQPNATLRLCRYNSMYDEGGWGQVCKAYDAEVQRVNEAVGGITYLGELNKRDLYREISEAAVMWYPGVSSFAETSCIAALEAQACGTPFVGSYRGALPETVPSGTLIKGDPNDPAYQQASVQAVSELLDACGRQAFDYRRIQRDGKQHAARHSYAVLAAQWEAQIEGWFTERYERHAAGVLRQLLHEDDHTAAKVVASHIMDTQRSTDPVNQLDEANNAAAFCDYVIAGKDQSAEDYAERAIDTLREAETSGRFREVIPQFDRCTHVLDVACGNGSFAIALTLKNPTVRVFGLDYAAHNIEVAREAAIKAGVADRCHFERCTVYDFDAQALHQEWKDWADRWYLPDVQYDGLFVGEFIEHVGNYKAIIDGLESVLTDGASVVYTCPHGAFVELLPKDVPLRRGHVHRFHHDDVAAVWGPKLDFSCDYLSAGFTERGLPIGNWLIFYTTAPGRPCGTRPLADRVRRTRPLQRVSVGMIVKDAENDLGRCLASIHKIADEIVIGDTGSTDGTKAIAAAYHAKVIDLAPIDQQPEGFAGARNQVLAACQGDWFLWIDADEQLMNAPMLRRYLDGLTFNGYVIHQNHLYLDGPPTFDIPVRLFRNTGAVRFYGCVHEQPQDGDPNADILPTLDVLDLQLAHTGYLTPEGREEKRVARNLPLLLKDQEVFSTRTLGKVLLLREAVIQADVYRARAGQVSPQARAGYAHAIGLFIEHFDDPTHKYHKLARPWYEAALQHLGIGWEQEIAMAGKKGGLGPSRAKPERVWVRDANEFTRIVAFKTSELAKGMLPTTFITDPDDLAHWAGCAPPTPVEATV